jgi:hypothetical protein
MFGGGFGKMRDAVGLILVQNNPRREMIELSG